MLTVIAALVGLLAGAALAAGFLILRSGSRVHVGRARGRGDSPGDADRGAGAAPFSCEPRSRTRSRRGGSRSPKVEERVQSCERELEQKQTETTRREQGLADREIHVRELQEELKSAKSEAIKELERVAGLTLADAKHAPARAL